MVLASHQKELHAGPISRAARVRMNRSIALAVSISLAACGISETVPPVKGIGLEEIASKMFKKLKPTPTPQAREAELVVAPEPAPMFVPLPRPEPDIAAPVHQPPVATRAKPKPKPQWQKNKKKTKSNPANGVGGYSCATVRLAGSSAAVEQMAKARGHVVTAETRRQIQSCFNEG